MRDPLEPVPVLGKLELVRRLDGLRPVDVTQATAERMIEELRQRTVIAGAGDLLLVPGAGAEEEEEEEG